MGEDFAELREMVARSTATGEKHSVASQVQKLLTAYDLLHAYQLSFVSFSRTVRAARSRKPM